MLGVFARVLESNAARQGMAHHGYSVEAQSFAHLVDIFKERVQGDVILAAALASVLCLKCTKTSLEIKYRELVHARPPSITLSKSSDLTRS